MIVWSAPENLRTKLFTPISELSFASEAPRNKDDDV